MGLLRAGGGCVPSAPNMVVIWGCALCVVLACCRWRSQTVSHLLHEHGHVVLGAAPVQLVAPLLPVLARARGIPGQRGRTHVLRHAALGGARPLVTGAGLEEARTLRQNQPVQQVAVLPAPVADDNLDVARVREDGKLVLRANAAAAVARAAGAVGAVSPDGRGARRVRGDRGRAADGERAGALGADVAPDLGVWVGNHALRRRRRVRPWWWWSWWCCWRGRGWCWVRGAPSRCDGRDGWRLSHLDSKEGRVKRWLHGGRAGVRARAQGCCC